MKRLLVIPFLLLTLGCGDDINLLSPNTPTPARVKNKIEFRVFGSNLAATPVTIRHTNSVDGMTNTTGLLPYLSTFESEEDSIFLYVEATAVPFSTFPTPTLQAQIFVDGKLFKEAAAQGFNLYVQAAGTYRR